MSLKAFHIIFICVSILLAIGFGAWEIAGYLESGNGLQLVFALLSFAVAAGLILYAIRFVRKLKDVSNI